VLGMWQTEALIHVKGIPVVLLPGETPLQANGKLSALFPGEQVVLVLEPLVFMLKLRLFWLG